MWRQVTQAGRIAATTGSEGLTGLFTSCCRLQKTAWCYNSLHNLSCQGLHPASLGACATGVPAACQLILGEWNQKGSCHMPAVPNTARQQLVTQPEQRYAPSHRWTRDSKHKKTNSEPSPKPLAALISTSAHNRTTHHTMCHSQWQPNNSFNNTIQADGNTVCNTHTLSLCKAAHWACSVGEHAKRWRSKLGHGCLSSGSGFLPLTALGRPLSCKGQSRRYMQQACDHTPADHTITNTSRACAACLGAHATLGG